MTKAEYLKKFSFFARWYLPAAEAEDVIGLGIFGLVGLTATGVALC